MSYSELPIYAKVVVICQRIFQIFTWWYVMWFYIFVFSSMWNFVRNILNAIQTILPFMQNVLNSKAFFMLYNSLGIFLLFTFIALIFLLSRIALSIIYRYKFLTPVNVFTLIQTPACVLGIFVLYAFRNI